MKKKNVFIIVFALFFATSLFSQNRKVITDSGQITNVKVENILKDVKFKYGIDLSENKDASPYYFNFSNDGFPYGFIILIAAIIFIVYLRHKRNKEKYKLMNSFVQNNKEIPAELIGKQKTNKNRDLKRGIILISLGLALMTNHLIYGSFIGISIIFLFIGSAYILVWFLIRNKDV